MTSDPERGSAFERCNLFELSLSAEIAHEGIGTIRAARFATGSNIAGACNFLDYAEVPVGATIGTHQHASDEEEYYLILDGTGRMHVNGETFTVRAGDLVRNPPCGTHGLENTGGEPIKIFVFELQVPATPPRDGAT